MDYQQTRDHLQILNARVAAFEQELKKAFEKGRSEEMDARFETERNESNSQIKLAEDMLARKKAERQDLLGYLSRLDFDEKSFEELRDFDWDTVQRLAENLHKPQETILDQQYKVDALNEAIQRVRQRMSELNEQLVSTITVESRLTKSIDEQKQQREHWDKIRELQKKRIGKTQVDNERLNILIRQCVVSNEPMSEYVTKNIQAKCHSFVNSENSQELYSGLLKFKSRQDRIINLLKYKDNKLGSETNKLQVVKDQTHDQVKFYTNMLGAKRNATTNMARINQSGGHYQQQHQVTFSSNTDSSLNI